MAKQVFSIEGMGKAGPYSHAAAANGFLFLSGQIPIDYSTNTPVTDSIEAATHQVLKNIGRVLEATGTRLEDVLKVTIFLADMADYQAVNEVYAQYFSTEPPARSAVAVKELPLGMPVEMEVIAVRR